MLRKEMARTLKFKCVSEIIWNEVLVDPSQKIKWEMILSVFFAFLYLVIFIFLPVIPSAFLLKLGQYLVSLS